MDRGLLKITRIVAVVFVLGLLPTGNAYAVAVLDFGTGAAGPGGTIVFLGGGDYQGSNIPLDVLTVLGAPSNNGVYDTQGAFASATAVGGTSAVLNFDTAADTISIVGAVSALGIGNTTLLSGTLTSFSCTQIGLVLSCSGSGLDTKDTNLLLALGLPADTPFELFGFSLSAINPTSGQITPTSTDIINTQSVQEPSTWLLLGAGLVGLAAWGRRRQRR